MYQENNVDIANSNKGQFYIILLTAVYLIKINQPYVVNCNIGIGKQKTNKSFNPEVNICKNAMSLLQISTKSHQSLKT